MEETALTKDFTPEQQQELKEAFELGVVFAEMSREEFMQLLKERKERRK